MARFEVDVKLIVEADDDYEAYHMVAATVENLVCGAVLEASVDGVVDLEMIGK